MPSNNGSTTGSEAGSQIREFESRYIQDYRCTEPGIPADFVSIAWEKAAEINTQIQWAENQMRKASTDEEFAENKTIRDDLVKKRTRLERRHIAKARTEYPKPLTDPLNTRTDGPRNPRFKDVHVPQLTPGKNVDVIAWLNKIIRACNNYHPDAFREAVVNFADGDTANRISTWVQEGLPNQEIICLIEKNFAEPLSAKEAKQRLTAVQRRPDESVGSLAFRIKQLVRLIARDYESRGRVYDEEEIAIEALREALEPKIKNLLEERHASAENQAHEEWTFKKWTAEAQAILDRIKSNVTERQLKKIHTANYQDYTTARSVQQVTNNMQYMNPFGPPAMINQAQMAQPIYNVGNYGFPPQWAGPQGPAAGMMYPHQQMPHTINAVNMAPFHQNTAAPYYQNPTYAPNQIQAVLNADGDGSDDDLEADEIALCQAVSEDFRHYQTGDGVVYRVNAADYGVDRDECVKCGQKGHFMRGRTSKACPLKRQRLAPKCTACGKGGHLPELCPRSGAANQQAHQQGGPVASSSKSKN